ncbi:hypothetical protein [Maioricimonas sp. JC845]|uniref:hypothetical protein n=1 Tax=Maioricimonas sp. JC845 TaxID=3232138 RepID=UPI00345848E2
MRVIRRATTWVVVATLTVQSLLPTGLLAEDWSFGFTETTTVEELARRIDRLERHIEKHGTVVAKSPDVWGQARLTKYRRDYEEELKKYLDKFQVTLNASISRSDQAYLANAFALQAAVGGGGGGASGASVTETEVEVASEAAAPASSEGTAPALPGAASAPEPVGGDANVIVRSSSNRVVGGLSFGEPGKNGIALEPTIGLDQLSRYLNHLNELRRISDGDDKADAPGYALHLVRIPVSVLPGKDTREGYGAEVNVIARPHLHEELLPTTFRGLVINDLADQLSFPLTKIVDASNAATLVKTLQEYSKLAPALKVNRATLARLTEQRGYLLLARAEARSRAAEIAARQFKLIELATGQVRAALEEARKAAAGPLRTQAENFSERFRIGLEAELLRDAGLHPDPNLATEKEGTDESQIGERSRKLVPAQVEDALQAIQFDISPELKGVLREGTPVREEATDGSRGASATPSKMTLGELTGQVRGMLRADREDRENWQAKETASNLAVEDIDSQIAAIDSQIAEITGALSNVEKQLAQSQVSIAPSRRSRQAFCLSHAFSVYGHEPVGDIASLLLKLKSNRSNATSVLILDAYKLLGEELECAYEFLNANAELWNHCHPQLADAVRRMDVQTLCTLRESFLAEATRGTHRSHTVALAWAIIVESALLNERLKEDIRDLAAAKNAYTLNVDTLEWMQFCGPNPSPEARMLFNEYVRVRWPIHVVTIDPITEDQNVADQFSLRREMQLALSLAFASGRIGAQNFLQTARRLELDMETIALNRTVVGFSHGGDTFGWRFYPRVQSPPNVGHFTAFTKDMLFGRTRDYDLRKRRIEPGTRECTAIVIMPSFVPYVVFDMRTNWFRLDNPSRRRLDVKDGVELSRDITEMRQLAVACAEDAHLYRPDEVYRLQRSVEQLERRLPLQSVFVQMPFENSLGGFEFFNSGVPDLAPELRGYYGEPGILTGGEGKKSTSIFLVGNHFSVHETKVIVGNIPLTDDQVELISRQVMRVKVPDTAQARDGFVDIHVATPYGVSNHVDVPALGATPAEDAIKKAIAAKHPVTFKWAKDSLKGCIQFGPDQQIAQVCIYEAPVLSRAASIPPGLRPRFFEFAGYVDVRAKGGDFTQLKDAAGKSVVVGPIHHLDFRTGKSVFAGAPCQHPLATKLKYGLCGALHPGMNIDAIRIRGFVRGESDAPNGLPIVPIDNHLTIEVKACTDCCPPAGIPCPEAALPPGPGLIEDVNATPPVAPAPLAPAPATDGTLPNGEVPDATGTSYRLPAPPAAPQQSPLPVRLSEPGPAPSRLLPAPQFR